MTPVNSEKIPSATPTTRRFLAPGDRRWLLRTFLQVGAALVGLCAIVLLLQAIPT